MTREPPHDEVRPGRETRPDSENLTTATAVDDGSSLDQPADGFRQPWDFDDHDSAVYTAGHLTGYRAGWRAGYAQSDHAAGYWEGHDDGSAWTKQVALWLGDARAVLSRPKLDELAKLRRHNDEPCSRGQTNLAEGRKLDCACSACTRYVACWINRRDFGTADYPGAEAAARIRGRVAA